MPGFEDSAFIVILALLLFGPKKLPVLGRQLGKLMGDFRRASNEFRTQMEEELRISEQADRQKQVAAIEASAPATPSIETAAESSTDQPSTDQPSTDPGAPHTPPPAPSFASSADADTDAAYEHPSESPDQPEPVAEQVPIATSGDLSILPPSTGLPVPNSSPAPNLDIIQPATPPESQVPAQADAENHIHPPAQHAAQDPDPAHAAEFETETLHG
ncbi:MAG TPA: twin-arginine translocase TatA/TatE family subunit [Acidobacteriaceae bacterium]